MNNKILFALRRSYHCVQTRKVLQQNALSYPVYEIGEEEEFFSFLDRAVQQGTEILITGDVYAGKLLNRLDLSVVTIRRSKIPFAEVIQNTLRFSDRTAIVWRETDGPTIQRLCRGYENAVSYFPYQRQEELEAVLQKVDAEGFRTIIGAGVVNPYAEKYGIRVENVPYDESDILSTVRLAEHNLRALEERQEHAEILNTIQDNIAEGIVALDRDGKIQRINRPASDILSIDPRTINGMSVQETALYCPEIQRLLQSFEAFYAKTLEINGKLFVLEGRPVFVHAIFKSAILTLTPVEKLQDTEQQVRRQLLKHHRTAAISFRNIVGESPALTDCIRTAQQYARVDSPILIYGQSGTGKEMFVQSIHNASQRKNGPFVVINCAALPENLIESELFGYEKGAFTGALSNGKQGLFIQGHQGTVFLDEVSEMPLSVQARFLRVLQEHEVMPVGSLKVIPVDIRVIAATNKDLKAMVEQKKFREDLYYRISVLTMRLPPLKERGDDIHLLIRHFLRGKNRELGLQIQDAEPAALQYLASPPYPGNIRQLSNLVERAMVLCKGSVLDLGAAVHAVRMSESITTGAEAEQQGYPARASMVSLQEKLIREALERNSWNQAKTAKELGISPSTLYRRMQALGIRRP